MKTINSEECTGSYNPGGGSLVASQGCNPRYGSHGGWRQQRKIQILATTTEITNTIQIQTQTQIHRMGAIQDMEATPGRLGRKYKYW